MVASGRRGAGAVPKALLTHNQEVLRETGPALMWAFKTSKFMLSDTPLPPKPHFLILPQQFHQVQTKHPNLRACRGHSHLSHHKSTERKISVGFKDQVKKALTLQM